MEEKIEKIVEVVKSQIREKMLEEQKSPVGRKRFFASDPHFNDSRLNLYGRDLRFKNAKEVNEHIIEVWNKTVGKSDLVYLLGDISMDREGLDILNELNGEKILIKGNYDISVEDGGTAKYEINDKILSKYFTKVVDDLEIEIGGEKVYLNHFPTNARADVFNIVGHIHGLWKAQRNSVNVGLDAWHFTPVSEDLIKFQMNGIRVHYDQNVYAGELIANTKHRVGAVKVLRAPEEYKYVDSNENKSVFVFLAGPIDGTNSDKMWQEYFIKEIQEKLKNIKSNKNIVICSPRRLEKPKNFVYEEQVGWEDKYLNQSINNGIVVFWLAEEAKKVEGRSFGQTSRFELGWLYEKGKNNLKSKIIIGAHKSFEGQRYIKYKFENSYMEFDMKSNEDEVIEEVVKQIKILIN